MGTTLLPTDLPKASEVVKETEKVADDALKKASELAEKLKRESEIDKEDIEKGFYGTIEKGVFFLGDLMNLCCVILIIIVIYYFYKGYAQGRAQYGGNIQLNELSDYTYD
tara:strand:- start:401 stop:730 length:330 start_codon:yes stop_codon:yes gene_type:complete